MKRSDYAKFKKLAKQCRDTSAKMGTGEISQEEAGILFRAFYQEAMKLKKKYPSAPELPEFSCLPESRKNIRN